MTRADAVIIYDPWWNPSKENQAIDRAHRIGQLNSVSVFRVIARGTVEERIVVMQRRKQAISDLILESDKDIINTLNEEDVNRLFEPMSDFSAETEESTAETELEV